MKQLLSFFALLLPLCLFGQVSEPFNNPDICAKYPWGGDIEKFQSGSGFLKLNDSGRTSTAILYLYGATLAENEWTFRIKSDYQATVANFQRVYLWCDLLNFKDHQRAWYIELSGVKDKKQIALIRTRGLQDKTVLISKNIANLNDAFDLHIRVIANSKNEISVYARSDNKAEEAFIGTSSFAPQTTPGYFILYSKYTTEHAKDKYFGPVTIKNFTVENTTEGEGQVQHTLNLLSVKQEDASTLILEFDRAVNPAYSSFNLPLLGEVDQIYLSENKKQLRLVWVGQFEQGKTYTLSYSDLYDEEENSFSGTSLPFQATFEMPSTPVIPAYSQGDVLISEVMANPKGGFGLSETEYIELHNTTNKEISLTGWFLMYGDKSTALEGIIPAGAYAVLYRNGREIEIDKGGVEIPLLSFPSALANTGKQLSLLFNGKTPIDDIAYPEAKPGVSWEREGNTWKLSLDGRGGTPGSVNSSVPTDSGKEPDVMQIVVQPHEFVFSEILPEPYEGGSEYLELYNRSNRHLPLSGLAIAVRKMDGSLGTSYSLSSVTDMIEAGEYVLLSKKCDGVRDYYLISSPESLYELALPILNNVSAKLVLFRESDEEVVDEVHYSEKWHGHSVKSKKGIALERIDLDGDSQDPANWTSASALSGGGTPGYRNSQVGIGGDGGSVTGIESPEYSPATGDYVVRYRLDRSGYLCRANIYDTSGRRVAVIADHELIGTEGAFSWDGVTAGGHKASIGVYIFHAELYHPQGGSKTYKKVFLVR